MAIVLSVSHGLYNAGLLGFYRILERAGKKHLIQEDVPYRGAITVEPEVFETFEQDYFEYFKAVYGEQMTVNKMLSGFNAIDATSPNLGEAIKAWLGSYAATVDRPTGSYPSAYQIIRTTYGDTYEPAVQMRAIKKEKDSRLQYESLEALMAYFKKYRDVFLYKDIAYNILDSYWGGIAFFNSTKVKDEMNALYRLEFVQPCIDAADKLSENGKYTCSECETGFSKKVAGFDPISTWLSDYGVDYKRKSSHDWNFKASAQVCPFCKLVLSCMPAGFFNLKRKGLFVNVNNSIQNLKAFNNTGTKFSALESYDAYQERTYSQIINGLNAQMDRTEMGFVVSDVEIIRREGSSSGDMRYRIQHLDENQLHILERSMPYLKYYEKRFYQLHDVWINLYTEILRRLSNGENLYSICMVYVKAASEGGQKSGFNAQINLMNLIKTQVITCFFRRNGLKGDETALEKNMKKVDVMYHKGIEMRQKMGSTSDDVDNKLRGLIYQLTNALQAGDKSLFLDRIIRLYAATKEEIPSLFVETIKDEDDFMNFGYAFVIGLKGLPYQTKANVE